MLNLFNLFDKKPHSVYTYSMPIATILPIIQVNLQISIMVDYAHEPQSMKRLLATARDWKIRQFFDQVIHIVSCDGVGRDDWKKPIMGNISYSNADFSVVTTENYDQNDDPIKILNLLCKDLPVETELKDVQSWGDGVNNNLDYKYIRITNRHQAMETALAIAQKLAQKSFEKTQNTKVNNRTDPDGFKVLIISTGIGSEQLLIQPQGVITHDERKEWVRVYRRIAQSFGA